MSPVGLGLVGLGRWSRAHAEAASRSDQVQFVSCFSRTKSKRDQFAREFGIDHTAGTFAELLTDPSVEAVVIATPNDLHVDMALEAMAAGKPAEPPPTITRSQSLSASAWRAPKGSALNARVVAVPLRKSRFDMAPKGGLVTSLLMAVSPGGSGPWAAH